MDKGVTITGKEGGFEIQVGKVIVRVRKALNEMFATLPDGVRKSRDVQKHLGVDANLSWQVYKLLATSDALDASRFVPAPVSMRRVFDAARKRGLRSVGVDAAESAVRDFESLIRDHAGDRANFESMIAGLSGSSDSDEVGRLDVANRKMVFKGHSYYWGVQVDIRMVTQFVHPSQAAAGKFDYGHLASLLGLRRFRSDANPLVHRYNLQGHDLAALAMVRETFDQESMDRCGAPAIAQFCTTPLPLFRTMTDADGETRSALVSQAVGQKSRVDLTFGTVSCDAPISTTHEGAKKFVALCPRIWLPTKLLIINQLMHRSSFPREKMSPSLIVRGISAQDRSWDSATTEGALPFSDRVNYLGVGSSAVHTLDVPRYEEMVRYACGKRGWNLEDFDVYRVRIEYPLLDTTSNLFLQMD